jgi:hypothetical protein
LALQAKSLSSDRLRAGNLGFVAGCALAIVPPNAYTAARAGFSACCLPNAMSEREGGVGEVLWPRKYDDKELRICCPVMSMMKGIDGNFLGRVVLACVWV